MKLSDFVCIDFFVCFYIILILVKRRELTEQLIKITNQNFKEMKKLVIVAFLLLFGVANAQKIGIYCNHTSINPGEFVQLELRVESAIPVVYVSYYDGTDFHHIYDEISSTYVITKTPTQTTTYELYYAKTRQGECAIDPDHKFVTISVSGSGGGTVQMTFNPPDVCRNGNPINLTNYLWSNTTGQTWFEGTGVSGSMFYPQLAGVGAHQVEAFILANGQTYSTRKTINVFEMPEVSLWLPSEVFLNESPFVLSGGRPSGGYYWGDGVVNGNTFNPTIAGEGWHTIYYSYTTANGCQDVAESKIYVRRSGNAVEESLEDSFAIYPNPTNGIVLFSNPCSVDIFSTVSLIRRENSFVERIDISDLPNGVYILRLFDGENVFVKKIVKE